MEQVRDIDDVVPVCNLDSDAKEAWLLTLTISSLHCLHLKSHMVPLGATLLNRKKPPHASILGDLFPEHVQLTTAKCVPSVLVLPSGEGACGLVYQACS